MFRLPARLLLAWTILYASPLTASAECMNATITTRHAIELASLVFQGKVIAIDGLNAPVLTQRLTFEVSQVWKGEVHRRQQIYQTLSAESRVFSAGDRLVVFARELSDQRRVDVGLPEMGPAAFGYMSFNCSTDVPSDIDAELPRMPAYVPR